MTNLIRTIAAILIFVVTAYAGTPEIIVQPANISPSPATQVVPAQALASPTNGNLKDAVKILKEMQSQDAEILKRQTELLQTLEEIGKDSNQIKAFVHRS